MSLLRQSSKKSQDMEVPVYAPEPGYAMQSDEDVRPNSNISLNKAVESEAKTNDRIAMTLEELQQKRRGSVLEYGKVIRKSSGRDLNIVSEMFATDTKTTEDDSTGDSSSKNTPIELDTKDKM